MVSIAPQITSSASVPVLGDKTTASDKSSDMSLDFGVILATGQYSDFRMKCEKHIFHVHKAILCSASPFFKAALDGNTTESKENVISMSSDEPAIIARLLIFIYTGKYFVQPLSVWKYNHTAPFISINDKYREASFEWQAASKLAVAMYQIADMTLINPLKWNRRNRFLASLRPDRNPESEGRSFWTIEDMEGVSEIVKAAYIATRADDWMLHDPIVHRMLIGMQGDGCVKWERHQSLMKDVPQLVFEIATSQLGGRRSAPKCGKCGKKTPQRLWRCACGQMEDCDDKECGRLRRIRAICDSCAKFERVLCDAACVDNWVGRSEGHVDLVEFGKRCRRAKANGWYTTQATSLLRGCIAYTHFA